MIHEEICTYEVCKLAKEKGFDEECRELYCDEKSQKRITRISCNRHVTSFDYCSNSMLEDYYPPHEYCYIAAPTQSLLRRWLREEKGYYVYPFFDNESKRWTWVCRELTGDMWIQLLDFEERYFDTYELALEDALKYTLENLI